MSQKKTPFFELRSGAVDTLHFVVKTTAMEALRGELAQRFEATPAFFSNETVAIDVRRLEPGQRLSLDALAAMLREFRMNPIGVVAQSTQLEWAEMAQKAGLPLLDSQERRTGKAEKNDKADAAVEPTVRKGAAAAASVPQPGSAPTMIVERPLRSGQQIYAKGDLIVLGLVSFGAEVIAEGNIHVYAPLRGRALAGVHGNHDARIFCTCLEPELVSIAGIYRTTEHALPPDVQGHSVQIRLRGEKLIFEPLGLK